MQNHAARSRHLSSAVGGGREDCWSEDATETLVEAWGDRYLQLNRGNLRQKDWKEIADTVNGRHGGVKPRKTDVQCKNRIDTVKKKYKLEKTKAPPSKWPFFTRLEYLIGANAVTAANKKLTTVRFTVKPSKNIENPNVNPNLVIFSGGSSSKSRLNSIGLTESSLDEDDDDDDDQLLFGGGFKRNRIDSVDVSDESAIRELSRAILKFGEIYERIESSKQQQMMEIEKQKMEFTKDLEFQRMNMFMDAQLELEKMKRRKHTPSTGKKL